MEKKPVCKKHILSHPRESDSEPQGTRVCRTGAGEDLEVRCFIKQLNF